MLPSPLYENLMVHRCIVLRLQPLQPQHAPAASWLGVALKYVNAEMTNPTHHFGHFVQSLFSCLICFGALEGKKGVLICHFLEDWKGQANKTQFFFGKHMCFF